MTKIDLKVNKTCVTHLQEKVEFFILQINNNSNREIPFFSL